MEDEQKQSETSTDKEVSDDTNSVEDKTQHQIPLARLEKEIAKRKQLEEKLEVLSQELSLLKENQDTTTEEDDTTVEDTSQALKKDIEELKLSEKKRQFGYRHNLSPEETDYIFRINPNPDEEILNDPFIQGGLKAIRDKKKQEETTPPPSSHSGKVKPPKPLSEMTPVEKNEFIKSLYTGKK